MSDVGWLARQGPPAIDVTPRFLELYARGAALPREFPILFVGGIFTKRYPLYLARNRRRLRELGLSAREVPIDTEGTVIANAAVIRDAVLQAGPCVLVGQSKGPLDIHAALALHPLIVPKVRAFVSLQAPFAGTPLATDAEASPLLRRAVYGIVGGLLRGSPRAYFEMGYAERRAFLALHSPTPLVPTLAVAARTERAGWPLERTRRYLLENYGAPNDGFVPAIDEEIPGARVVRLQGMDHASLALRWLRPRAPFEPGRATEALIALALEEHAQ